MSSAELILYTVQDGGASIQLSAEGGSVWRTQAQIAALFDTSPQNITQHIKAIYAERELTEGATCKQLSQVRQEGGRAVNRTLKHYNLDVILAVGYRVRSTRATQFRRWATARLREYLIKGFAMDDARLKDPNGSNYFDELLARIRDIRASEKRFHQKVRDLYATAVDYDSKSEAAQLFFRKVQDKMLWAVTGQTAPEIIAGRADATLPNMGLTTWRGGRVRKQDVAVARNYLRPEEIDALNRIVVMYLDYAEDQVQRRRTLTMRDWEDKLDAFLQFIEREVLGRTGSLCADVAEKMALQRYEGFDAARRKAARLAADAEDTAALEQTQRKLERQGTGKKR